MQTWRKACGAEKHAACPTPSIFSASPFDCLNPDEQRLVRDSVGIVYFREDETILDIGIAPTHLFVMMQCKT